MKRKTAVIFYLLGGYVLLQFSWWAFHLIELTQNDRFASTESSRRVLMVLSEGLVFFILLLVGLWYIRKSIIKELRYSQNQRNFLLSVTHELKTPLAAARLSLQTMKKRKLDEQQQGELLDRALGENQRLSFLVENILQATRIDQDKVPMHPEWIDLDEFLNHLLQNLRKSYPDERLIFPTTSNLRMRSDKNALEIILRNLIDNAFKYGDKEAPVELSLLKGHGSLSLSVINKGESISTEEQVRIFQKFYRSGSEETRKEAGTGLGLYLAKEFAQLNGHNLIIDASFSGGAKFDLNISTWAENSD